MSSRSSQRRWRNDGPYVYEPFQGRQRQIRLLHLLPGTWSSPLRIKLSTIKLFDSEVEYEALSYVWGSTEPPATVLVVHGQYCWTLNVTKNCETALRFLRPQSGDRRVLWIDAICINQADLEERSEQVKLMVDIYEIASRVPVWLGRAENSSRLAMQSIRKITARQKSHLDSLDAQEIFAFCQLASRPWFSRLWTWQEVWGGASRSSLMCGHEEVSWSQFRAAMHYIARHGQSFFHMEDLGLEERSKFAGLERVMRLIDKKKSHDTLRYLEYQKLSHCTDARDRIYTAQNLAIAANSSAYWVRPDYTKSIQDVFITFATKLCKRSKRLVCLSLCRTPILKGLPSWVPDWSSTSPLLPLPMQRACGPSGSSAHITDKRLHVRGIPVDRIAHVAAWDSESLKAVFIDGDGIRLIDALNGIRSALRHFADVESEKYDGQSLANDNEWCNRLCDAMFVGLKLQGIGHDLTTGPYCQENQRLAMQELLQCDHIQNISLESMTVLGAWSGWCEGRSLVKSEDGHLGLGPAGAMVGDRLVIMLGCDMVTVLRPAGLENDIFVGSAYVAGWMDGEIFMGPLPSHFESGTVLEGKGTGASEQQAFKNLETGRLQRDDPRLPALPAGWTVMQVVDDPIDMVYRNEATGEVREWWEDPRCDAQELSKRGIVLEEFSLV